MNKRILFLFGTRATSRTFSEFQILDKINGNPNYEILCALREHSKYPSRSPFIKSSHVKIEKFSGSKKSWERHQLWLQISMARRRKTNKSFAFKTRRALLGEFTYRSFPTIFHYLIYLAKLVFRSRSMITLISMIPKLGSLLETISWNLIPKNVALESLIREIDPSLIVVVSTGSEPLLAELQKIQHLNCKWILLPDNWDNVFTKTIVRHLPYEFWVWSEQQRGHLIGAKIAEDSEVRVVGSSRLSLEAKSYLAPRINLSGRNPYEMRVLYAGQESAHDEISDLVWIYRTLTKLHLIIGLRVEIVYRPHPTARPRSTRAHKYELLHELANLNSEIGFTFISHESNLIHKQNQNVAESLSAIDLVIGAPTTLLLESLFYGIPSAVILRNDHLHRTSSGNVWLHYLHFSDLERVPNFHKIMDESDLVSLFQEFKSGRTPKDKSMLEYFTGPALNPYSENLMHAIDSTLARE